MSAMCYFMHGNANADAEYSTQAPPTHTHTHTHARTPAHAHAGEHSHAQVINSGLDLEKCATARCILHIGITTTIAITIL
jgi:hypothetical protein